MKYLLAILLMAASLAGCSTAGTLRVEPVNKALPVVTPKFERGVYRVDRDRNLYFVLKSSSVDKVTKKPVEQIVVMRVFWEPLGGTTSLNPASLNATYRYIVMTPDAVGMYEGAGFVRMHQYYGAQTMKAWVVQGDLRLTESTAGFNDTLGRSGFAGSFSATLSDMETMDQARAAQRDFFSRSLEISARPATQPATAPATEPATAPATAP